MKHQYHFGSRDDAALNETAKLKALISDLDRVVRILDSHISTEEERAGVSDPFSAAYPILARVMTARRDNLKETIAALERRLSSEPHCRTTLRPGFSFLPDALRSAARFTNREKTHAWIL
jgi:hypothetical protein